MRPSLRSVIAQVTRGGASAVCRRNFSVSTGNVSEVNGARKGLERTMDSRSMFKFMVAGSWVYVCVGLVDVAVYYRMVLKDFGTSLEREQVSRRRETALALKKKRDDMR